MPQIGFHLCLSVSDSKSSSTFCNDCSNFFQCCTPVCNLSANSLLWPSPLRSTLEDKLQGTLPTRVKTHNLLQVVNRRWTMLCCQLWTLLCCSPWTMLSTRLFNHDNNVVAALLNHQYCYILLTRLSNNDEQACSVNIVFFCSNNRCCFINAGQPIAETIVNNIVRWTTLFSHDKW